MIGENSKMGWGPEEGHFPDHLLPQPWGLPLLFSSAEAEAGPGLKPDFPDELSTARLIFQNGSFIMSFPNPNPSDKTYEQKAWL